MTFKDAIAAYHSGKDKHFTDDNEDVLDYIAYIFGKSIEEVYEAEAKLRNEDK